MTIIFTEEEQALFNRSPKKIQRFIRIYWRNADTESFDGWMHTRSSIHGAQIYSQGKNSDLLREWYELAIKRSKIAMDKEYPAPIAAAEY